MAEALEGNLIAHWLPQDAVVAKSAASSVPVHFIPYRYRGSVFSGTQYLTKAASIIALADSGEITIAGTFRFDSVGVTQSLAAQRNGVTTGATNIAFRMFWLNTGSLNLITYDSATGAANSTQQYINAGAIVAGVTFAYVFALNNATGEAKLRIDDVDLTITGSALIDQDIGFASATAAPYAVGARSDSSAPFSGIIGNFFLTNQFIDPTTNWGLFFDQYNNPIDSTVVKAVELGQADLVAEYSTVQATIVDEFTVKEAAGSTYHIAYKNYSGPEGWYEVSFDLSDPDAGGLYGLVRVYLPSTYWVTFIIDPATGLVTQLQKGLVGNPCPFKYFNSETMSVDASGRTVLRFWATGLTQFSLGLSDVSSATLSGIGYVDFVGGTTRTLRYGDYSVKHLTHQFPQVPFQNHDGASISGGNFLKTGVTVDSDGVFTEDTASNSHGVYKNGSWAYLNNINEFRFTYRIKPLGRPVANIWCGTSTGFNVYEVDLILGTVVQTQTVWATVNTIAPDGDGFWLITLQGVSTGATTADMRVYASTALGQGILFGNDTDVYVGDGRAALQVSLLKLEEIVIPALNMREYETPNNYIPAETIDNNIAGSYLWDDVGITRPASGQLKEDAATSNHIAQIRLASVFTKLFGGPIVISFDLTGIAGTHFLMCRVYTAATDWEVFVWDITTGALTSNPSGAGTTATDIVVTNAAGPDGSRRITVSFTGSVDYFNFGFASIGAPTPSTAGAIVFAGDNTTIVQLDNVSLTTPAHAIAQNYRGSAGPFQMYGGGLTKYAGPTLVQATEADMPVATINLAPDDISAYTVSGGLTPVGGQSDPFGGTNAYRVTSNTTSLRVFTDLANLTRIGDMIKGSVWLRSISGSADVFVYRGNASGNGGTLTITTSWAKYEVGAIAIADPTASNRIGAGSSVDAQVFDMFLPQYSITTGQLDTNVMPPFVPFGAAPRSLVFDGVSDLMNTIIAGLQQPTTIYLGGKQITWANGRRFFDGLLVNTGLVTQNGTTPGINAYAGFYATQNTDLALNTDGIVCVVFNGASSLLKVDSNAAVEGNSGTVDMGGFTLAAGGGTAANWGNIEVNEIRIYEVAHTTQEIQEVLQIMNGTGGNQQLRLGLSL